ncbi:hypothetical protein F4803DRAFT_252644 [Xylaria telfairii]|nr:hypothetical protein F4803DRAFT_252644 [Xylaria telfairii]
MLMMRRQNNSCDQCRKAKRACDAAPLAPVDQEQRATRPCSYCYKTKKYCTRYWARSQSYANNSSARQRGETHRRRGLDSGTIRQPDNTDSFAAGLFDITPVPVGHHDDLRWWNPASLSLANVVSGGGDLSDALQLTEGLYQTAASDVAWNDFDFHDSPISQTETSLENDTAFLETYTENHLEQTGTITTSHFTAFDTSHTYQDAGRLNPPGFYHPEEELASAIQATRGFQSVLDWSRISGGSPSPFSPQHILTSRTHNNFISQNLMHVYHDVFEHNLSCWVSEESCPYKMPMRNRNESQSTVPSPNLLLENTPPEQEWGDVWSNRIYTRVIKLDRAAQMTKMIQLTRSENQAASKALHLSIMAFSSQWAQKSRRERKQYSPGCGIQEPDLDGEMTEEFDRQIQHLFWWQARKALDDCADLECYRVVCAELVFGLTQKPWEKVGYTSRNDGDSLPNNEQESPANAPIMPQIQAILSRDGPPVFIERAARKAHTLKYMMDSHVAGLRQPSRTCLGQTGFEQPINISNQDRQTVGFLHWLVVMFDTVSASMNQRPVVVADRDCQHDAANGNNIYTEQQNVDQGTVRFPDQRWAIHLFMQDNPKNPTQLLRWPCTYDAAARAVTRSGPVKILLYRHVHYLQDAIQRGYRGELIEEIIRNTVLVYRYWNTTYGVFFRDLIQNYSTVPPRIQNLLEWVDEAGLGHHHASQVRAASETVENLRRASADELADLARIVIPPDGTQATAAPPPPQLPGFHSAVNKGSILTEPWTIILIRAFSKAFAWHFDKAQLEAQNRDFLSYVGQDVQRRISQCTDCVKALWQLGKKSDMAWTVAETLASALAGLEQ